MEQSNSIPELEQLKTENHRLRIAVEELSVLNDIATAISSTLELDRVVAMIVQKCVKHLKGEQGAIWLLEEQDQEKPWVTVVRTQDSEVDGLPYRLDTQLTGWMIKNQKPLIVQDLETDDRFQITKNEGSYLRSLLAVPLQQKGKMIGVLSVFNKRGEEGFLDEDSRLLTIIGAQSAQVIESARLYLEEQELIKMMQEMNLARKIQTNLLPTEPPKLEGYEAFGISIPAKDVGGDYYESMGCKSALDCLKKSNQLLYHSTDMEKYATMFYGIICFKDHQLIFANAGHNNPFLVSQDGSVRRLKTVGIPLGWLEDFDYTEEKIPFNAGDVLVTFSDGISEAMNEREEEFEEEPILDIIKQNLSASPKEITDKIIDAVQNHAGNAPQADDMTLVVIKRA
jgi:sigma-B regulation protein RsbU (phosphoserine phosphatase)